MSEGESYSKVELANPHVGDPRVDPRARTRTTQKASARNIAKRRIAEMTMGLGFFPLDTTTAVPKMPEVVTKSEAPVRERSLLFNEGMPMFRVSYDSVTDELIIPRTWDQANQLFLGRLPQNTELAIDKSCLEKGKKGDTVIKRVGKSRFGAFTIAHYPTTDENGKDIDVPILVDMRRRSRKQNLVDRFRRETSTPYYYSRLPRFALGRR